jgi:hypothetical protein
LRGIRKPLLRNAIPKGFSLGGMTWHVVQEVSYRRANIGSADTGAASTHIAKLATTHRNTVVYLSRDCQKAKNIGGRRRPWNQGFVSRFAAELGL